MSSNVPNLPLCRPCPRGLGRRGGGFPRCKDYKSWPLTSQAVNPVFLVSLRQEEKQLCRYGITKDLRQLRKEMLRTISISVNTENHDSSPSTGRTSNLLVKYGSRQTLLFPFFFPTLYICHDSNPMPNTLQQHVRNEPTVNGSYLIFQ